MVLWILWSTLFGHLHCVACHVILQGETHHAKLFGREASQYNSLHAWRLGARQHSRRAFEAADCTLKHEGAMLQTSQTARS